MALKEADKTKIHLQENVTFTTQSTNNCLVLYYIFYNKGPKIEIGKKIIY